MVGVRLLGPSNKDQGSNLEGEHGNSLIHLYLSMVYRALLRRGTYPLWFLVTFLLIPSSVNPTEKAYNFSTTAGCPQGE